MKRYYIYIVLFLVCSFCNAQSVIRRNVANDQKIEKVSVKQTKRKTSVRNNKPEPLNGYSSIRQDDGSTYEGYFVDGQFSGQGTYTFKDGMKIKGQFANGCPNGECEIIASNGFVFYKGNMSNGDISGHGVKFVSDSIYIEGDWSNDGDIAKDASVDCLDGTRLFYGSIRNGTDLHKGWKYDGYTIEDGFFDNDGWHKNMTIRSVVIFDNKIDFVLFDVPFTMIKVVGGTFDMGATKEQKKGYRNFTIINDLPVHKVTLYDYYIAETEVTQELWTAIMEKNPSRDKGVNYAVTSVSWDDCQLFVEKLCKITGINFRLPTEAEWEFAARGGINSNHTKFSGSNDVFEVCSAQGFGMIKTKKPNELGIYDMSGNVAEWCSDYYADYEKNSTINPKGPLYGEKKTIRGSTLFYHISYREYCSPSDYSFDRGLRLAFSDEK